MVSSFSFRKDLTMNKLDNSLINYISSYFTPSETLVIMKLYYYGNISWKDHEVGDWFFKSMRDMAKELSLNKETVQNTYQKIKEKIKEGILPFLEMKIEKRNNFNITYFKFIKDKLTEPFFHRNKDYKSNESTLLKDQIAPSGKTRQYCPEKPDGINIVTHNNSMYRETPPQPEQLKPVELSQIQTDNINKMIEIWNKTVHPTKLEVLTSLRQQQYLEVLAQQFDNELRNWQDYCTKICQSSFLMKGKFTLRLTWALKPEWINKVLEGRYDDHDWRKQQTPTPSVPPVHLPKLTLNDVLSGCRNEVDRKIKPALFQKLGAQTYGTWIYSTGASFDAKDDQLYIHSCGQFTQSVIKTRFWKEVEIAYA